MGDDLQSRLDLVLSAVEFLDSTNQLGDIDLKCQDYLKLRQNVSAFRFVLNVNPAELTDLNVELGNLVLNSPDTATSIFQEVVYTSVMTQESLPASVTCGQIQVVLRIQELPTLPMYVMKDCRDPQQNYTEKHFIKLTGVICGMTMPTKYTQSARYICPIKECLGSQDNLFIRLHVAGAKEVNTISKHFTCPYCSSQLHEDAACRQLSDMVIIEILDKEAFSSFSVSKKRFQALTAIVRDELTEKVHMGQTITLIGFLANGSNSTECGSFVFEVNNIIQPYLGNTISQKETSIPSTIKQLLQDRSESPWSFALSLAYIFADCISPMGTFLHLKLGLLLCLIGTAPSEGHDLMPLLVIGHNTLLIDRLLRYALSFTERSVHHIAINNLVGSVSKDKHGTGTTFIEAGSILLAGDGVCYLGDVGQMNKASKEAIQKTLESGTVNLVTPSKLTTGLPQQICYQLRCNVWAHTELQPTKCSNENAMQNSEPGNISKSLADVFGMVYYTETDTHIDNYVEHLLIQHTLRQSMNRGDFQKESSDFITEQDFRQFLTAVRNREIDFTSEAERLIRGYYIGSRRVRSSGIHGTQFPLTAMKTLMSLARTHAKLSLRQSVLPEDAVMAILLYEEAMMARFGYPVIPFQSVSHIQNDDLSSYLGPQNDVKMRQFHDLLLRFCSAQAGDLQMEE